MKVDIARFVSLLFVALALGPSLAHVLELPNKIDLSHDDYLTVQQLYRGWAWLGVVVIGALLSTLVLAYLVRARRSEFLPALASYLCVVGAQIVYWTLTHQVNKETDNWTVMPDNWETLRMQWEYSHAAGAAFNLAAFIALVLAVMASRGKGPP
jgi:hypothetical protein